MTRIDYHFADGSFARIRLSRLPKDIARELVKHEQKEAYQRKRDCTFRHGTGYQEGESEISMREFCYSNPVADVVENCSLEKQLRDALCYLSSTQQRRLWLYAQGYTYAEIGEMESVNERAIRKSVKLGKKKIKILLENGSGFHSDF